ncbi:MAG: hypothetical protein IJN47_03910, partial [Clostridia bacterium]|nr:hypothetical protein [Clostridia bacterium]
MVFYDITKLTPQIFLEGPQGIQAYEGVTVTVEEGKILVTADRPLCKVYLRWAAPAPAGARILGDAWERAYGDLQWMGVRPERIMPWYMLVTDGNVTHGYGVETGCASLCSWRLDGFHTELCLDLRCGPDPVELGGRTLHAATLVCREGLPGETPFQAAHSFCQRMCPAPRLPRTKIYGSNNWYYAYGVSSQEQILSDAKLVAELTAGLSPRPYMVIDDCWQPNAGRPCNAGPWDRGNAAFPDMAGLAADIAAMDLIPGIWYRPLTTYDPHPQELLVDRDGGHDALILDPSQPEVLREVEEMTATLVRMGYRLLKHDFSSADIFGRWGFQMGREMFEGSWHFHDRTKTTAEIILQLYRAIRRGAGDAVVIGCNTVSHLAAGIFELQRTGDDTSGLEWERTRKMGVNTLAFRMMQHGAFYLADADCAGHTGSIPWELN